MDQGDNENTSRECRQDLTEKSVPFATQLGFHEYPDVPTVRGNGHQNQLTQGRPQVMRLGLNSKFGGPRDGKEEVSSPDDCGYVEPRVMRLGHDSSSSDETVRRHHSSPNEPSVLRLACKSTAPQSTERNQKEGANAGGRLDITAERGGGDDEPYKRSKYNSMSQTSSLSTSLPEIPYEDFEDDGLDNEQFKEFRFLLTLSPVDRLDQLLRGDQNRGDGDAIDQYKICNPTPYLFQPDRWSCGYRNLQMLLGSLRVLKVREDKHFTTASTASRECATGQGSLRTRTLPLDISERMMVLAGVGDTSDLSTQDSSSSSSGSSSSSREDGSGSKNSNRIASSQASQNDMRREERTRIVARSASLRGGYERTPSIEGGVVPSVLETQMLVEQAWQAGFDPEGLEIFRPEGVRGNERWIGEDFTRNNLMHSLQVASISMHALLTIFVFRCNRVMGSSIRPWTAVQNRGL
jgi:hypothetical protein